MALSVTSAIGWLATVRKALVTAIGVTITALTAYHAFPALPDQPLVVAALAALTTLATYLVPNAKS